MIPIRPSPDKQKRPRPSSPVRVSAKWLDGHWPLITDPPGKASNYIHHACEYLKPKLKVVLFVRVSEYPQGKRRKRRLGQNSNTETKKRQPFNLAEHLAKIKEERAAVLKSNLELQEQFACVEYEKLGAEVVRVVPYAGSGKSGHGLIEAKKMVKALGAHCLGVTDTSRLVRNVEYSMKNQKAQPSEQNLELLKHWMDDIPLVTLLHPDASSSEIRSFQTKYGQQGRGSKGGRPSKTPPGAMKERYREKIKEVQELHEQGLSVRAIARLTGVPRSTVCDWIQRNKVRREDNR